MRYVEETSRDWVHHILLYKFIFFCLYLEASLSATMANVLLWVSALPLHGRVADPDPDLHGSALIWVAGSAYAFKLRIRIRRAKMTKKYKKYRIFMFWSAGCFLLRAEGFSCSLGVLYGGLGISKLQFLIKKIKIKISSCNFFVRFRSSNSIRKNAGSGSVLNQCGSATLLHGHTVLLIQYIRTLTFARGKRRLYKLAFNSAIRISVIFWRH